MKLQDIEVGGRYRANVSQNLVTVRVVEIKQVPPVSRSSRDAWRTVIVAVNEATGRHITIRSPLRLRSRVGNAGCDFCRQAYNRPGGNFTCLYCQARWTGATQEA